MEGDPDSQTARWAPGVSCASYWWTRISAAGIRATHHLLGPKFMLCWTCYSTPMTWSRLEWASREEGMPLSYCFMSAIQGKTGPMKLPVMLRVLMSWLADRLEGGDRLQKPDMGVQGAIPLVFYTHAKADAKAEDGRAWIGGFLDIFSGWQKM